MLTPAGQVAVIAATSIPKRSLLNNPPATTRPRGRRLGLAPGLDPGPAELLVELARAIGGIPVDDGLLPTTRAGPSVPGSSVRPRLVAVGVVEEVGDQVLGGSGVPVLPGVTVVAVMISESGSTAAWPLYPSNRRDAVW